MGMDLLDEKTFDEVADRMVDIYDRIGLVYVTNTGLDRAQHLRKLGNVILQEQMDYTGGANPRKPISENVYDVGAPLAAWIHYHHEMQYVETSTKQICIFCIESPGPGRGYTYVSDACMTTDAILQTPLGQKLKDKGLCYVRNLTDKRYHEKYPDNEAIYNHWQDSFMTDDMRLVEIKAAQSGLRCEWDIMGENRFLRTKFFVSAYEYFEKLDRNILYGGIGDDFMWFDAWPDFVDVPPHERPLKLKFGDGSDLSQEERQQLVDVHDQFGFPVPWKNGDLAVICNWRYAHGRPAIHMSYGEERILGVMLGPTFQRQGQRNDKWKPHEEVQF